MQVHQALAQTLNTIVLRIRQIQLEARQRPPSRAVSRPLWPMLVLRTPKGWTGPGFVDGHRVEGTWRAHQVPLADFTQPLHLQQLEEWLSRYRPEDLFDAQGALMPEIAALAPSGHRRMSANPHANGGVMLRALDLPGFADYAVSVAGPGLCAPKPPECWEDSCVM